MNPTNIPSAQARLPGSLPPALIGRAQTCLENAVTFALDTQHANGSWAERPEARILDTATVTYALSSTPAGASACTRARVWLEQALPQCHDEFTAAADHWLRLLASSPTPPPLPILPRADGPHARRALLLDGIGVSAGSAGADAQRLLHSTTTALSPDRGRSLKSWQRTMLLALEIIARQTLRLPIPAMTLEALESEQGDDGRFHGMPLLTAVAYLALTQTVPGRASTRRSLSSLLADQQADGTWRFPTFDVWDTSLMVRFLRGHPTFHKYACTRALAFLERTQSADGGWGCTSAFVGSTALASDNDTTGSVLLALANTPTVTALGPPPQPMPAHDRMPPDSGQPGNPQTTRPSPMSWHT